MGTGSPAEEKLNRRVGQIPKLNVKCDNDSGGSTYGLKVVGKVGSGEKV